ncbi:unnamed protein product [Laminaria digitata]
MPLVSAQTSAIGRNKQREGSTAAASNKVTIKAALSWYTNLTVHSHSRETKPPLRKAYGFVLFCFRGVTRHVLVGYTGPPYILKPVYESGVALLTLHSV